MSNKIPAAFFMGGITNEMLRDFPITSGQFWLGSIVMAIITSIIVSFFKD